MDGPSAERLETTPARSKGHTESRSMEKAVMAISRDKIGVGEQSVGH